MGAGGSQGPPGRAPPGPSTMAPPSMHAPALAPGMQPAPLAAVPAPAPMVPQQQPMAQPMPQSISMSGPLAPNARPQGTGGVPAVRVRLQSACSTAPAPWRGNLPAGSPQAATEDTRSVGRFAIAVADGVAATRQLGVASTPYAQALADACVQIVDAAVQAGGLLPPARDVVASAMDRIGISGAASLCVAFVDPGR